LVQIRQPDDPMGAHELGCVTRRVGDDVALSSRNIFEESPTQAWLDECDGMILGGSGDYSVHDPRSAPWVNQLRRLLDLVLDQSHPTFGICFGHQLLAYHLGAPVNTDANHAELGTTTVDLTDEGRNDPVFGRYPNTFHVHTGHSDHVSETPKELVLLASNAALETQAFRVKGASFYSTQFHPDLCGIEAMDRYVAYHRSLRPLEDDQAPPSNLFRPNLDESATLIRQFLDKFAFNTG